LSFFAGNIAFTLFKKESLVERILYAFVLGLLMPSITYFAIWLVSGLAFNLTYWLAIYIGYGAIGIIIGILKGA
ncbi:MAG: hypothetical protein QXP36_15000, partial [Conexivisphaerales archaeon]